MRVFASCLVFAAFVLTACAPPALVGTDLTERPVEALPSLGAVDVDALVSQYEDEDGVFINSFFTVEHNFGLPRRPEWQYVSDRQLQYVVLDPEADWLTTQTVRVNAGGKLVGMFSRVTAPDGTVKEFTQLDAIVDEQGDTKTYRIAYPGIEKGSLIEESSRVRYTLGENYFPPLQEDFRIQSGVPIQNVKIQYIYPETWGLQIKRTRPGVVPQVSVMERYGGLEKNVVMYTASDIPAYKDEEYSPYYKETGDYLELRVTGIDAGYYQYKPADSWQKFAEDFSDYAFKRGGFLANPVKSATQRAIRDESVSDSLKLVQIVDWVQNNIELGRTDKNDLNTIVREGKGNALMICGLTQAMLDRVGVSAEFLLIHPQSEGFFDDTFISASQVSIPAVGATIDGRDYIVFPFLKGLPVTYIPAPFQGSTALEITPDGFGGFRNISARDVEAYAVEDTYDIRVDEDGIVRVEETKMLRDIAAYVGREQFKDLDQEEREEEIREMLTYSEGRIEDLEFDLNGIDAYGTPLEISIRYTIPDLVTVTPEEVIFQTGGLLSPASLSSFKVDVDERQQPIRIYYDTLTNKRITLRYPETWSLTTALEDVDARNRFGEVEGRYTLAPGEIVAEQRVYLRESEAPASAYPTLLDLTGSRSGLYVPTLVFSITE